MDWLAHALVAIGNMGPWAPVLFVVTYVAASVVLAPVFVLTVAAGALFGVWRAILLVLISKMIGSSVVFVQIGRAHV